ncbi:SRm160/300 splicing coactivator [Ophiocordyceps camponoti-floridani]|uniref:SRm160/300 splicing coactivator n=1 Tax=Ophiocordyceps camponoti-floridani TaxID=2030778 RepID=A0A8H4VF39_9HYPO|nr:SRm160/300 splicing coactivator [Ophiocordyceps camponoti-floridani]
MASRPRPGYRKPEPTLLTDFLRGRPSPARRAAQRKHRLSVEAVKAELRQEMRQNSVRQIQAPGGVRQRVQAWQKASASAVAKGDPDEAATEPTELAFADDDQASVTEEDRIRIRNRAPKPKVNVDPHAKPVDPSPSGPPKKRVVSDDNWRKTRGRKSPPRQMSPKVQQAATPKARPIPSDFVHRSAPNLPVSAKVKAWAAKVDAAESPPTRPNSRDTSSRPGRPTTSDGKSASSQATAGHAMSPISGRRTPFPGRKLGGDGAESDPDSDTDARAASRGQDYCLKKARPETRGPKAKMRSNPVSGREPSSTDDLNAGKSPSQPLARDASVGREEAIEEPVTPTRPARLKRRAKNAKPVDPVNSSDEASSADSEPVRASDLASSLAPKSVANIVGEIPFGHSAFSELDARGVTRSRRPKEAKHSHKSMPNVFKKVMEEGKKMIQDMNEPPKQPIANAPPSIESWLKNTVDPFVDSATAKIPDQDDGQKMEQKKARREARPSRQPTSLTENVESSNNRSSPSAASETPKRAGPSADQSQSPSSAGLRRRQATRGTSSPLRSGSRRPLLGVLKEAFHGESTGHVTQPKSYLSHEERKYECHDEVPASHPSSDRAPIFRLQSDAAANGRSSKGDVGPLPLRTRSKRELSTILSEEESSALGSDLTSDATHSTLTQSTMTADSEPPRSPSPVVALQRRLTRHSDLVSMLSLPEDTSAPSGLRDKRSRPSLRRMARGGGSSDVTADELLQEFVDDESLYVRELKTLVDGVVPVLLSHVLDGTNSTDLFGSSSSVTDALSKAVVGMGVALEKLKNAHRKAPVSDVRRLANWAHGLVPIYNSYLNAWRLGFEDVVVNLAPASAGPADDDSLLNALPRNDKGDVVDAQGERVAVAYLLKRPLMRVKQLARLFQCVDTLIASVDTHALVRDFDHLEAKARRRHREETARMTDEDAVGTDTSRARDLRTLDPTASSIEIDDKRQVNAKDLFSLSLAHSNGQRLECRVELVRRDKQSDVDDRGDLLVRETGGGGRRCSLLFAPLSIPTLSARAGRSPSELIVMARGSHDGQPWHETLVLSGDSEDQIRDWLDMLPSSPEPPFPELEEPSPPTSPETTPRRAPVEAAQKPAEKRPSTPTGPDSPSPDPDARRTLPSRQRSRASTPTPETDEEHLTKTPTRSIRDTEERSRPLKESMRPDPRDLMPNGSPDGSSTPRPLPPPPLHRSPGANPWHVEVSTPAFPAPKDSSKASDGGVKRRGSSPLKHEYLPSETSAVSSSDDYDSNSSDDEIDSLDIPETELGISIRQGRRSDISTSTSSHSLTPSHSASQGGWNSHKPEKRAERFLASVSRWSDKGTWKDISTQPCHVVVTAGLVEAYDARKMYSDPGNVKPLLALGLTPLVLIRQSTAIDLEVRSSVQPHCQLHASYSGGNFRFRCHNAPDSFSLYMSVHHARLNNEKFIQLENEARFRSFGERKAPAEGERSSGSRQRSWFGRRDSYRGSVRAPSQSQDGASSTPSSTPSASSFLRKLTLAGNLSFNIARSSVDKQSSRSCGQSLHTLGSWSSSGNGSPRTGPTGPGADKMQIRLHLLVAAAKWEDLGSCTLQVRRPPPGWHQALRANHGLEKRVTASTMAKKEGDEPKVVLDAVLGSGCFQAMGSRGIVCGVWEEVKDGDGVSGMAPATGATGGNIKKWCFQFPTVAEASWMLRLLHQEVLRA